MPSLFTQDEVFALLDATDGPAETDGSTVVNWAVQAGIDYLAAQSLINGQARARVVNGTVEVVPVREIPAPEDTVPMVGLQFADGTEPAYTGYSRVPLLELKTDPLNRRAARHVTCDKCGSQQGVVRECGHQRESYDESVLCGCCEPCRIKCQRDD